MVEYRAVENFKCNEDDVHLLLQLLDVFLKMVVLIQKRIFMIQKIH
jgi:hypothetical protein